MQLFVGYFLIEISMSATLKCNIIGYISMEWKESTCINKKKFRMSHPQLLSVIVIVTCLIAKLSFSPKPSKRPKNKYLKTNWPTVGWKVFSSSFVNLRAFLNKREKTKLSTLAKSNQPVGFSWAKFDRGRTGALPGGERTIFPLSLRSGPVIFASGPLERTGTRLEANL